MLWKKESDQTDAVYVDLLQSPSIDKYFKDFQNTSQLVKDLYASSYEKNEARAYKFWQEGYKAFAKKKWTDAMEWYNKSMCFAKVRTEQMGLAYANRSSSFLNLKMYRKCLIDIEYAKVLLAIQQKNGQIGWTKSHLPIDDGKGAGPMWNVWA